MYLPLKNVYVCSGSKIFSTFIGFLKSKDPKDGTEQVLLDELSTFNDYLKENVSSFCLDDRFHNLSLRSLCYIFANFGTLFRDLT